MPDANSEKLLEAWTTAWSAQDPEAVLVLFTNDCVFEDVTFGVEVRGKEELRGFCRGVFAAVPDFKIQLRQRFAANDWAAVEWVMSGTQQGDFPGLPATGKQFSSVRGASVLELRDGKILRESDYWDSATFARQVGLLPSP